MRKEENVPNERLRRTRHLRGWTQSKLAEMLGTDFETVSRWERGITLPSAYFREQLCSVLNKTPEELGLVQDLSEPIVPSTSPCVFLAAVYVDAEREFTAHLKTHLHARGVTVLSIRTLRRQGENQRKAIQEAIRTAQIVLLIASPEARSSRHVQYALQIARIFQSQICAVWIDGEHWQECIPKDSGEFFATIDVREQHDLQIFEEIVATLEEILGASNKTDEVAAITSENVDLLFEPRNPYKGLRAFQSEDRDDFFGRDALVGELAGALHAFLIEDEKLTRHARFLAVVGPSGSGKSSVVMAGFLPHLQAGGLPDSQHWVYLDPILPGAHPIESLAVSLGKQLPKKSLKTIREDLEDDSTYGLYMLASSLGKPEMRPVVLFIDQFEELFTQTNSEEERQHFIDLLVTAVIEPRGSIILILTLRADFYDRPIQYLELCKLIESNQRLIPPMAFKELREVIEKPAGLPGVQVTFEGDLMSELLFGVQEQAGALPLLQFTLDQLFQRRSGHQLTLQAYEEIGGVKGAVAKHAEATYNNLFSQEHRKLTRVLFLRLIEPGTTMQETTRRRIPRSELLLSNPDETVLIDEVVLAFTTARLLTANTVSGEATVEVSHEAVIREWTRLSDWLDETREDVHHQQTISKAAAEWARHGKPRDRLYRGNQLKDAQEWTRRNTPSESEATFLRASAAHRMRSRVGVVTSCILVVLLFFFIGFQNREVFFPPDPTLVTTLADNGSGSLRQAVLKAKPGGTITFDTHLNGVINLLSNIAIDRGPSLRGPGARNLSITGSGGFNVLLVEQGASVTISGLAFNRTNQLQKSSGIIINEGTLTLANITVSGNSTYNSGSITNNFGGTLTLNNSTTSDNTTNSGGAGISNFGVLTINTSTLSHNTTNSEGGGIYNSSSLTLRNSSIIRNTALAGAGITNDQGDVTLSNSTIAGNSTYSHGFGGGIFNVHGGTLTLTNSTFSGNSAGYGGGVDNGYTSSQDITYNRGGPLKISNSTFSDNTAIEGGGIRANSGSQTKITFTTIFGNTATGEGGGIANKTYDSRKPGQIELRNTLVAENRALLADPDIAGLLISDGYNLIQNSSGTTFIPNQMHLTDVPVHARADLRISSLLSGNQFHIHTLLHGSPAIDRIPLNVCHVNGISTDQRGMKRPEGNENFCDIGAYESSP